MELDYVEREVVIRNRGSVIFSDSEQAADILLVDVKCEALAGTNYFNTKTQPPYGYYGEVTLFGGATVCKKIPLLFVYQRVIDFESDYRRLKCYLTKLEAMLQFIGDTVSSPNGTPPAGGDPQDEFLYRGVPYSAIKIKSDRAAQWTITVRAYSEDDANCQSIAATDDPTKGESEYPEPSPIPDPDNFPAGLPLPTAPDPDADPDDFDPDDFDLNFPRAAYFGVRIDASTASTQPNCIQDVSYSQNFEWSSAGPPPYTVEFGFAPGSPCNNAGHGFRIVAADGTKSQDIAPQVTVFGGELIVFQYTPF